MTYEEARAAILAEAREALKARIDVARSRSQEARAMSRATMGLDGADAAREVDTVVRGHTRVLPGLQEALGVLALLAEKGGK
jgi:hypothetical protein